MNELALSIHRVLHTFESRDLILSVGSQTQVYLSKDVKLVLFKFFMRKKKLVLLLDSTNSRGKASPRNTRLLVDLSVEVVEPNCQP